MFWDKEISFIIGMARCHGKDSGVFYNRSLRVGVPYNNTSLLNVKQVDIHSVSISSVWMLVLV